MQYIIFILLCVVLGFGTWNPFEASYLDDETSGISINQIVSILCIALLFLLTINVKSKKYPNRSNLVIFVFILFMSTVFNSFSYIGEEIMFFVKIIASMSLIYIIPKVFINNTSNIHDGLLVFSIVSSIVAFLGLSGLLGDVLINHSGRIWLFNENPNSTGTRMALSIFYLIYFCLSNPKQIGKKRFFLLLLIAAPFFILIMGGSRGSILILVISILIYLLYGTTSSKVAKYVVIALMFVSAAYGVNDILNKNPELSLISRFQDLEEGGDAGRKELNKMSISILLDNNVLIGTGNIKYTKEMLAKFNETRVAHNMYVYIFVVSGLFGVFFFLLFIYGMIKRCWRYREIDVLPGIFLLFMLLIAYKTGGVLTYLLMWFIFSIIISLTQNVK